MFARERAVVAEDAAKDYERALIDYASTLARCPRRPEMARSIDGILWPPPPSLNPCADAGRAEPKVKPTRCSDRQTAADPAYRPTRRSGEAAHASSANPSAAAQGAATDPSPDASHQRFVTNHPIDPLVDTADRNDSFREYEADFDCVCPIAARVATPPRESMVAGENVAVRPQRPDPAPRDGTTDAQVNPDLTLSKLAEVLIKRRNVKKLERQRQIRTTARYL